MFSWNTFQLFHPNGGVSTKLSGCAKTCEVNPKKARAKAPPSEFLFNPNIFISIIVVALKIHPKNNNQTFKKAIAIVILSMAFPCKSS